LAKLLREAKRAGVRIEGLSISLLPDGRVILERPELKVEL
ncbi:MAG: DNA/RNA nuclease SfsA, partial [Thermococcus sp.]